MNNSFSKLLSIVIATVIVLSTFTTAFAVDNEEEVSTTESTVTTTEPVTESSDPTVTTPTDSTEPTEPTKPTINYSGVAGKNLRYYFNRNNGTLHISGIGTTMNNYSKKNLPPWHSFASNVKAVYVNKATNLTNIGSYMCADMINLQKIYYSKKLKSIGKCAFLNTKKLTALTLNRNISRINVDAFKGSKTPIIKVMNPSLSINFGGYTIPKTTKIQCYGTNTPIYKYARVNGNNVILMISSITLNTKKVVCKELVEPFVWCYADGDSILYAALVLMLMLSALPRMDTPASYLIFRTTRRSWLIGQIITVLIVTFGYCLMILLSSMLMCIGCNVYATNRWSETATMLSFAPAGFETALTVMRKTVKLTTPWGCCAQILGLMFQYVLLLSMLQLLFAVLKSKKTGILAAILLNFVGFVLTPERFMVWLHLPTEMRYYANVLAAWLSPLQHATYTMHNFGYDLLPRLQVSYLILGGLTVLLMALAAIKIRTFQFNFAGGVSDV